MMATTHAFVGLAIAAVVATLSPALAVPAAVAGFAGGLFPDLDLAATHRKTLHFPVYYWIPTAVAGGVAVVRPGPLSVGVALFFLAAAVHSGMDVLGGGLELRPWEGTSDRAVYVHATGRWLAPMRAVRYDGAPEDLALSAAFAVPGLLTFGGEVRTAALVALGASAVYALVRKRIVEWAPEWMR